MSETNTSYEVCISVGGRWEIHSRYPSSGSNDAVEEAKQLEKTSRLAVRVIREVYNTETGLYRQSIVYKGSRDPGDSGSFSARTGGSHAPASLRGRYHAGGGGDFDADDDIDFTKPKAPRKRLFQGGEKTRGAPRSRETHFTAPRQVTIPGLIGRIALITLFGLMVAAVITGLVPVVMPKLAAKTLTLVGGRQTSALFVVFIATFFVSFTAIAGAFLSGLEVIGPRRRSTPAARRATPVKPPRRRLGVSPDVLLKELKEGAPETAAVAPEASGPTVPEPPAPKVEEPSADPEKPAEVALLEPAPEPEEDPAGTKLSPDGERQKEKMAAFLSGPAGAVATGEVDAFSRFGINLFLAGAVDSLATTQGLEPADSRGLLQYAVRNLGTPVEMAGKFAEGAAGYLMQPRYIEMYEMGRRSMVTFLEGDAEGAVKLTEALETWRSPVKQEEKTAPLAVLFTDIVGSTNMTVTLGDEAAQYVVRTHNRIVRSALTNFAGREIKHTGDGIMASFATVSNAVEAAIEIQRRAAANNEAEGDVPLHLSIGINAGEPVVEDDDLFGVTVQLSARLCALAGSDQIMVSEVVRGLCSGKNVKFVSRGTHPMKGFSEPVMVHEVLWRS